MELFPHHQRLLAENHTVASQRTRLSNDIIDAPTATAVDRPAEPFLPGVPIAAVRQSRTPTPTHRLTCRSTTTPHAQFYNTVRGPRRQPTVTGHDLHTSAITHLRRPSHSDAAIQVSERAHDLVV